MSLKRRPGKVEKTTEIQKRERTGPDSTLQTDWNRKAVGLQIHQIIPRSSECLFLSTGYVEMINAGAEACAADG